MHAAVASSSVRVTGGRAFRASIEAVKSSVGGGEAMASWESATRGSLAGSAGLAG